MNTEDLYRQIATVRFRNMITDPPEKTGRYCVGHAGAVFGDAYYTAQEGDTHYSVGWSQVPSFRPEFWLDMDDVKLPRGGPRVITEIQKPVKAPERKKGKFWGFFG